MHASRRVRTWLVGVSLAALTLTVGAGSVGATVPEAVNPNLPVASGGGTGSDTGSAGLNRSTIQNPQNTGVNTNVSGIPSRNPNETNALYRPGGTYVVYSDQTQAVTTTDSRGVPVQRYDSNGNAIYQVVAVGPVTQNPPNGTVTGESNAYIPVGPYTFWNYDQVPARVIVTIAYP